MDILPVFDTSGIAVECLFLYNRIDGKNEEEVKAMLRDVVDELVDVLIVWLMNQLMYFCLTSA